MTEKIAIIGTGISGLTCGYLLQNKADICVFEANDYIGGHTATVDIEMGEKTYAIDTGFIVFNDWTYPNFINLMDKVGVKSQATEMSFSVKNLAQNLEYNGNTINSLFAQRRNLLRPRFHRIVRDILRFNKTCKNLFADKTTEQIGQQTLGQFLTENGFSEDFCDNYILPMCAAIWSSSLEDIKAFPLAFFLQFFNNHGLLNVVDRPQWRTIIGGSKQYIKPMTAGFSDSIQLNAAVEKVERHGNQYLVTVTNKQPQLFDQVIFACHSDQALSMLGAPSEKQKQILGAIPYQDNEVVLHTDESILPKRKLAWASWNYLLKGHRDENTAPTSLTYNMNILQGIRAEHTFCVTLNNSKDINPDKILRTFNYAHPQFSQNTILAQKRRGEISGADGLHFCGAYWYNGFHEDGVRSALDVCAHFGVTL